MNFGHRFRVQRKLMDALYGCILQCEDTLSSTGDPSQPDQLPTHPSHVAVKVINLVAYHHASRTTMRLIDDPRREYQIIQRLQALALTEENQHPHLVRFHGSSDHEAPNTLVFIMEFCANGDLVQCLRDSPQHRFDEAQALHFFKQIVSAVEYLHDHELVHRDLSLENVLLTDQNVCKLCDFGLCAKSSTRCVGPIGKRYYMAPESACGTKSYDPVQADLWSLGIMLFIMLTGSPLVDFAKDCEVVLGILGHSGATKVLELWGMDSEFTTNTKQVLNGLLQLEPTKRLPLRAIDALLASESSLASS